MAAAAKALATDLSVRETLTGVYDAIVVELKAISDLNSDHEAQLFNYLRISRQQIGYLLNFGKKAELQWKRFILTDLHWLREEGNTDRH